MFGKVLTAMVTPFDENGKLDLNKAKILAEHLVNNGSDGIVVAGTTGESPTLSDQEKLNLFSAVKQAVGDRAKIIAGTGSNNTAKTAELTAAASQINVDGIMLVTPYYNKPSQEGLFRHFQTVAAATDKPIILYNVPGRTITNLLPATVSKLAEIENIVAIKEASGNLDQISELQNCIPEIFSIYCGDDSLTLPMLTLGAEGVISVASHIVGNQMQAMIKAFTTGQLKLATEIHLKLFPLIKVLFITTNPVPVKAALNLQGFQVGSPRLPLIEATSTEIEAIKSVMATLSLL